jgi:hypothetical protein
MRNVVKSGLILKIPRATQSGLDCCLHILTYCIKIRAVLEFAQRWVRKFKAHTDQTRFGNATRIFSFQKQIKPSIDKNFT